MTLGSTPATALATIRARGCFGEDVTKIAAAPSLMPLDEPAVTVPFFLKAGFSVASFSAVVPSLKYSSLEKDEPSASATGTSSSVNTQAFCASCARRWLSAENASCSTRVIPYCSATFSAVSPREMVQSDLSFGFTKRHPTVVSAISGALRLQGSADLSITVGARVMDSTPPAMNRSPSPDLIACEAAT